MSYWFHPDAESEFNQVIDYYEEIEAGFGYDFRHRSICNDTTLTYLFELIACLEGNIRRCLVKRFPYIVYYH